MCHGIEEGADRGGPLKNIRSVAGFDAG